ncbi:hypothetical protein GQ44DRAFT_727331 [Phaeosphaeriaceae sp. PMI808]|nr:hypothetical protein GQ44DRAFT_727331 [Phaeosphaeriaceae sp. PMI808]
MFLQLTTGPGSLVALGIGMSDIATMVALGKQLGNWLTAASGDEELLKFLDTDELEILRRRGLIDFKNFNRIWGHRMLLLANGKAMEYKGQDAEKVLEKLGRFTAIMVCLVATMDAFMSTELVRFTLRHVLLTLFRTTEYGEDCLASRYSDRLNSWRSSSVLRGLAAKAHSIRRDLLKRGLIVEGLVPQGKCVHLGQFLIWLLTDALEQYITPSSDIAAMAVCLAGLAIDILNVEGFGDDFSVPTSCRVGYSTQAVMQTDGNKLDIDAHILNRISCAAVSLIRPEEALTNFPIESDTANRCRTSLKEGSRAAEAIKCRVVAPDRGTSAKRPTDLQYAFWDTGTPLARVQDEVRTLVSAHAFVINNEICRSLENFFQHEPNESLQ